VDLIQLINPEHATEEEVAHYAVREAARAIVRDTEGFIALLHVTKKNYYKLPGGGLEGDEDKLIALQRECEEEIGCNIDVLDEVGMTIEYRKMFQLKQISYCYYATVRGEKGTPHFVGDEIDDGFEALWLPFDKALDVMKTCEANDFEGSAYIVPRDIAFLEAAQERLN